jgi:transcriptional regulator with XRE-family HTH domain
MSNSFYLKLAGLRGSRSKADFARFLAIPAPMYHRYELGQVPQHDNLKVIADKCNCTVDWLLEEGFGSRLQQSREKAGLSRELFVKRLGGDLFTVEGITRIENGIDPPSSEGFVRKCAELLGVQYEWLVGGDKDKRQATTSGPCPECAKKQAQIERLERVIDKLTK